MTDRYTSLRNVLDAAFAQAATGKGAERHANGEKWTKQPIFTIAQQVGDGFNAGQVIKKVQEAQQMAVRGEFQRAQHEVLGAIVYAASLHVLWQYPSQPAVACAGVAPPVPPVPPVPSAPSAPCAPPVPPAPSTPCAPPWDKPNHPWPINPPILTRWQGGDIPVKLNDRVKLWLRRGEITVTTASLVSWKHSGRPDDILAFELVHAA